MKRIWLQSLLPGVSRRIVGADQALYLTFDDGPDPHITPQVLDVLQEFGARATFFMIGGKVLEHRSLAEQIVARGHLLGNHSFSHRRLTGLTWAEQLQEVTRTEAALRSIDGLPTHPFRPPYGVASVVLIARLRLAGIRTMYWSVDSRDFRHDSAASIAILSGNNVKSGDVVLLHDDHVTAVEVLRGCLPQWSAAGFKHPVAVGEEAPARTQSQVL
jgi:peptidoglycan/xylan/chitin deacetylase (PgdA/CDA1 family)